MNKMIFGVLIAMTAGSGNAISSEVRSLQLDQISLEQINIQGQVQTWRVQKICIDEQAYLMLIKGLTEPVSISASFKEGRPEQCHITPIEK